MSELMKLLDYCDLAGLPLTFYRTRPTVQQFMTLLSVLFVMPLLQGGTVFLKL